MFLYSLHWDRRNGHLQILFGSQKCSFFMSFIGIVEMVFSYILFGSWKYSFYTLRLDRRNGPFINLIWIVEVAHFMDLCLDRIIDAIHRSLLGLQKWVSFTYLHWDRRNVLFINLHRDHRIVPFYRPSLVHKLSYFVGFIGT